MTELKPDHDHDHDRYDHDNDNGNGAHIAPRRRREARSPL